MTGAPSPRTEIIHQVRLPRLFSLSLAVFRPGRVLPQLEYLFCVLVDIFASLLRSQVNNSYFTEGVSAIQIGDMKLIRGPPGKFDDEPLG